MKNLIVLAEVIFERDVVLHEAQRSHLSNVVKLGMEAALAPWPDLPIKEIVVGMGEPQSPDELLAQMMREAEEHGA